MIPETETSVIAAIGPLNSKGEANAHDRFDKTTEDIRIDFTSRNVHECTNSLYNIPDSPNLEPWTPAVITDKDTFSVRIGPTGAKRGYSRITGIDHHRSRRRFIRSHLASVKQYTPHVTSKQNCPGKRLFSPLAYFFTHLANITSVISEITNNYFATIDYTHRSRGNVE